MPTGRRHAELGWLLSQVTRRLDQRLRAVLELAGLTLAQWRVLQVSSDGAGHGDRRCGAG